MPQLSVENLRLLRTKPHRSKFYLGMFKPPAVFAGRITQANAAKGSRTFAWSQVGIPGGSTGTMSNVQADMTMYVGSTPGAFDMGKIRVRSLTASLLTVAENDDIEWSSGTYFTIVNFFEIWGVYPHITLDGDNNPSFFKDYDIAYTNQNRVLDPVPVMGPPYAGFGQLAGGSGTVWFDATGSYAPDETGISSYSWTFPGAIPATYNGMTPGYVAFPPGYHMANLTVTSGGGKSYTGHRPVMMFQYPGSGTVNPVLQWGVGGDIEGDYNQGGYRTEVWVREQATGTHYLEGNLGIIFAEDFYDSNSTGTSLGGVYGRQQLLFVGHVQKDSVEINPTTSVSKFSLVSPSEILRNSEMFPVTLEAKTNPGSWNELIWSNSLHMNVDRSVHHYLRWHTTVHRCCDVFRNKDQQSLQFADWQRGPIYDALDNFLNSTLFARLVCDRSGRFFTEKNLNKQIPADRTASTVMEITRQDWLNQINVEQRLQKETSFLEIGGLQYGGGSVEDNVPYISYAPGRAPHYKGKSQRVSGLVLTSQTITNMLSGKVIAAINNEFPAVEIPLAGNYRTFDIAPQEFVELTMGENDNNRGLEWSRKRLIPRKIRYKLEADKQTIVAGIMSEAETDGPTGVTGDYPSDPPIDPPIEEIPIPPPPPEPIPEPIPDPVTGSGDLVYLLGSDALYRTRNFLSASPNWENITGALPTSNMRSFILEPEDPKNSAWVCSGIGSLGVNLWQTTDLDSVAPTWTLVLDEAGIDALGNYDANNGNNQGPYNVVRSNLDSGRIYLSMNIHINLPTNNRRLVVIHSHDGGFTWHAPNSSFVGLDQTGGAFMFVSTHNPDVVWVGTQSGVIHKTTDGGHTWSTLTAIPGRSAFDVIQTIEVPFENNAADQVMIVAVGRGDDPKVYRSTNGGSSWTDVTPSVGADIYGGGDWRFNIQAYTSDSSQMIAALRRLNPGADSVADGYFFTSFDGGITWDPITDLGAATGYSAFTNIGQWPVDFNRIFLIAIGTGSDMVPLYSADGGVTWENKAGDLSTNTDMDNAAFGWHNIVPVEVA